VSTIVSSALQLYTTQVLVKQYGHAIVSSVPHLESVHNTCVLSRVDTQCI
jgi:hypothetical protein